MLVYQIALLSHSSRVLSSVLIAGATIVVDLCMFSYMSTWVSHRFSGFLSLPKIMSVGELATLSADKYMNVFPWCPGYWHPIKGSQDRLRIHRDPDQSKV